MGCKNLSIRSILCGKPVNNRAAMLSEKCEASGLIIWGHTHGFKIFGNILTMIAPLKTSLENFMFSEIKSGLRPREILLGKTRTNL